MASARSALSSVWSVISSSANVAVVATEAASQSLSHYANAWNEDREMDRKVSRNTKETEALDQLVRNFKQQEQLAKRCPEAFDAAKKLLGI